MKLLAVYSLREKDVYSFCVFDGLNSFCCFDKRARTKKNSATNFNSLRLHKSIHFLERSACKSSLIFKHDRTDNIYNPNFAFLAVCTFCLFGARLSNSGEKDLIVPTKENTPTAMWSNAT